MSRSCTFVSEASWVGPSADPVHVMFTLRESSLFFLHRLLVRSLIANLHKVYVEDASGASSVFGFFNLTEDNAIVHHGICHGREEDLETKAQKVGLCVPESGS